jgi:hypothetical protein
MVEAIVNSEEAEMGNQNLGTRTHKPGQPVPDAPSATVTAKPPAAVTTRPQATAAQPPRPARLLTPEILALAAVVVGSRSPA